MTTEAEKSHDPPLTGWRLGKDDDVWRSESQRADGLDTGLCLKVWEPGMLSAEGRSMQAESKLNLSLPFCSIQALDKLDDGHSHCIWPTALLCPLLQMLVSSRNTLTDTPRKNI